MRCKKLPSNGLTKKPSTPFVSTQVYKSEKRPQGEVKKVKFGLYYGINIAEILFDYISLFQYIVATKDHSYK